MAKTPKSIKQTDAQFAQAKYGNDFQPSAFDKNGHAYSSKKHLNAKDYGG
jgi:hypothetical protein